MNRYEAKQEARRARLEARAERLRREGQSRIDRARDMASVIPFGQPILIGHHSEGRDRNYRSKIRNNFEKGFQALEAADQVASRAASVGLGGISSDDPKSVAQLTEQLNKRKASQERMTQTNKLVRKKDTAGLIAMGHHAATVNRWVSSPIYGNKFAAYTYELSNNSANIRRIERRIAELGTMAQRETNETLHNSGVRLVENAEENRVQLIFPGKPADDIRATLKQQGFRWSPAAGAWQRQLNDAGLYAARCILDRLTLAP